jgi:FKBP-type peptidyl-prolyl cis-trans isomerase FklB
MKRLLTVPVLAVLLACSAEAQDEAAASAQTQFASEEEKSSYAVGMNIGKGLKQQAASLDIDAILAGLRDGFGDGDARLSEQEMQATLGALQQRLQAAEQARMQAAAGENLAASQAFLEQNKQREGVQTTASGLQYEVIEAGDGAMPTVADTVTVHYRGTLPDGTVFDSSYDRGEPVTFPIGGVIPGWQEALQLMKVGSKYKLAIPPDLAYGANGAGPVIGPNQALIFDVELLGIQQAQAAAPPAEQ